MSEDILHPTFLVIPKMTTAVRNTLVAEPGTIIFDTTQSKLCICKAATAAAASWELVTSVQES